MDAPPTLVSSVPELKTFLLTITQSNILYIKFEGNNLSRHGTISIITILIHPLNEVRLIDILTLGELAFTTVSSNGTTLKSVLEDPTISKCIWDVRNDADALWARYKIGLAGITDIQLLENASRRGDKTYVRALEKTMQRDWNLGFMELNFWLRVKKDVQELVRTDVFVVRPMDPKIFQYCINDVIYLPQLRSLYLKRIESSWLEKAMAESSKRVNEARSIRFDAQSPSRSLGPWGGNSKRVVCIDEKLDMLDEKRQEDI